METTSPFSALLDQTSTLTRSWVNFSDRAGITALPNLALRPEQTMHHGPHCLWAKQQGGFALCVRQKDRGLEAVTRLRRPVAGRCVHGLWDVAFPVFDGPTLLGVFHAGGWTRGESVKLRTDRPYRGPEAPLHSREREAELRRALRTLSEVLLLAVAQAKREGRWPVLRRSAAQWAEAALESIRTRYVEDLSLSEVAKQWGVNAHHLGQMILRVEGRSFRAVLLERRLHAAKGLLLLGLPIREVAVRVGWGDPNYFTARFTKAEGMSPRRWRERNRGTPTAEDSAKSARDPSG